MSTLETPLQEASSRAAIIRALRADYTNQDEITTVEAKAPACPGEGNGLLQTGLEISLVANERGLDSLECGRVARVIQACRHESTPMLWRSPWKKNPDDTQKHDDYYGAGAMGAHAGILWPIEFFHYAESVGWMLNIQRPGTPDPSYYFDKILGFRAFVKAAALLAQKKILEQYSRLPEGVATVPPLTWREQLELALALLWDAFVDVKKSDSCMKTACVRSVVKKVAPLVGLVADFWRARARKTYGTLGKAFVGYFKGAHYPLTWRDWK